MATRPRTLVRASVLVAAGVIVGAAVLRPFHPEPSRSGAAPGRPALERPRPSGLVGVGAEGVRARVRRSKAKGVVVSAWASWCGPCKEELPMLLRLPAALGGAVEVLLVSVDDAGSEPEAVKKLVALGAPMPSYVVDEPLESFKPAINPRWPGMIPATFLFDPTGKLRYFWGGPVYENEITPLLRRYLGGEAIDGEAHFGLSPGAVER